MKGSSDVDVCVCENCDSPISAENPAIVVGARGYCKRCDDFMAESEASDV